MKASAVKRVLSVYRQLREERGSIPTVREVASLVVPRPTVRQAHHALKKHGLELGPPSRRPSLSEVEVVDMLGRYIAGESITDLAREYGVHNKTARTHIANANGGEMPERGAAIAEAPIGKPVRIRPCLRCDAPVRDAYFCKGCKRRNEIDSAGALL